ncbi:MAG TPA: hypothetical protein PKZ60_03095 [Candidatus Saccharicenans sp.]|nr:hypothetical protein [Candidatus Saccharicenans sp.]
MQAKRRTWVFVFFMVLATFALSHVVVHDFFCHEEFHHLLSPIHHAFGHPDFSWLDLIQPAGGEPQVIYLEQSDLLPSGFSPVIFHPPD